MWVYIFGLVVDLVLGCTCGVYTAHRTGVALDGVLAGYIVYTMCRTSTHAMYLMECKLWKQL